MAIHNVRYLIQPRSACPAELKTDSGLPKDTCEVDTDFVARCAIGEILQTSKNSAPILALFDDSSSQAAPNSFGKVAVLDAVSKCGAHFPGCSAVSLRVPVSSATTVSGQ
jgi:hypothetical protein